MGAETPPTEEDQEPTLEPLRCYHCEQVVPRGAEVCPRCLRKQMRVCFCGNRIHATAGFCEFCGADWRRSVRVHRRTKRRLTPQLLLRAAAPGCGIALLLAVVANQIVDGLARRAMETNSGLPGSFSARLALALQALGEGFATIGHAVASHSGSLALLAGVALAGAAGGVLYYLHHEDMLHIRPRGSRVRRRRKNRSVSR
jgi:hypothetical protein